MIRAITYSVLVALAGQASASDTPPSGMKAELHETIFEPVGVTASTAKVLRLRYVAAEVADKEAFGFNQIEADFVWLCTRDGLEFVTSSAPMIEQIIVSISSEIVPFGETAPNVVQYFDAFKLESQTCIWEGL